jgi:hypothetical protein
MKTDIVSKVLEKEIQSSIPQLQQELVEAVIIRKEAWKKFYDLDSEYKRMTIRHDRLEKELEHAKQLEQSAIQFLVDSIAVQN